MRELIDDKCSNERERVITSQKFTSTTSKLELFIVCRFGKLSSEDQNLLRIASIIGISFSSEILFGLLSPKMRYQMETSVQSLKEKSWILDSIEEDCEYVFVHPLFHQTLYDLTPAGDRAKLHSSVASFILEVHHDDPTYYNQLGHHYSLSSDHRPKAFEYFVKASIFSISKGPNYCESGLKLLRHARSLTDTAVDCECALGIIEEQRSKIIVLKTEMIKEEKGTPVNLKISRSPSKAIFNFRSPRISPKNASNQDSAYGQTHQMTSDELGAVQDLFEAAELEYHETYEEYLIQNLLGVVTEWQIPYTKRFDYHRRSRNHNGAQRKNSIWDLRIEDIGSEIEKIRKSFLRRQSLRKMSLRKLEEDVNHEDIIDNLTESKDKQPGDVKEDESVEKVIKKKHVHGVRRRSSLWDSVLSRKSSAGIVRKPTLDLSDNKGKGTSSSCLMS